MKIRYSTLLLLAGLPTPANAQGYICRACTAGNYSADGKKCQPCPAGTYTNATGRASCSSCPVNTYSGVMAVSCSPCADSTVNVPSGKNCGSLKVERTTYCTKQGSPTATSFPSVTTEYQNLGSCSGANVCASNVCTYWDSLPMRVKVAELGAGQCKSGTLYAYNVYTVALRGGHGQQGSNAPNSEAGARLTYKFRVPANSTYELCRGANANSTGKGGNKITGGGGGAGSWLRINYNGVDYYFVAGGGRGTSEINGSGGGGGGIGAGGGGGDYPWSGHWPTNGGSVGNYAGGSFKGTHQPGIGGDGLNKGNNGYNWYDGSDCYDPDDNSCGTHINGGGDGGGNASSIRLVAIDSNGNLISHSNLTNKHWGGYYASSSNYTASASHYNNVSNSDCSNASDGCAVLYAFS